MSDNRDEHQFSADRPIQSRTQDILGRVRFAESVGKAIGNWHGRDSLVVGLHGPWGCGKSSVVNMVVDSLPDGNRECPYIVRFNPWQVSGQDTLTSFLFAEIAGVLRLDPGDERRRLSDLILKYGRVFSLLAPAAGIVAAAAGMDPASSAAIAGGTTAAGQVIQATGEAVADSEESEPTLSALKNELGKSLADLDKPILIVIDDIDRLQADEMQLIFRLVKSNLDFPNLVFLLVFQRDVVEASLTGDALNGVEYLKKIVQVAFDVPEPPRATIERMLFDRIDDLRNSLGVTDDRFDTSEWLRAWNNGLSLFFDNLRDVYRYINSIGFSVGQLCAGGHIEVNLVDMLILEALRVFEHEVFRLLSSSKWVLSVRDNSGGHGIEEAQGRLEEIAGAGSKLDRYAISQLLSILLPQVEWAFREGSMSKVFNSEWLNDLRIAHPTNFDRYFTLTVPDDDVSQAELKSLLTTVGETEEFKDAIAGLNSRGLLGVTLDRLAIEQSPWSNEETSQLCTCLIEAGDHTGANDGEEFGAFSMVWALRFSSIVDSLVRKIDETRERTGILNQAFSGSSGLFVPLVVINREWLRRNDPAGRGEPMMAEDDLTILQNVCVGRIVAAAGTGYLCKVDFLDFVLGRWAEWGSKDDVDKWVKAAIDREECLKALLVGFLQDGVVSTGTKQWTQYSTKLERIEEYTPIEPVQEQVAALRLSDEERDGVVGIAKRTFEEAIRRRTDGDTYAKWSESGDTD